MIIRDIGILSTALWEGDVVNNDRFAAEVVGSAEVKDPFRGRRAEDGTIRIAGMEFTPEKYPRTVAAIAKAFNDPFRGARRRRYFPPRMKVSDAESDAARKAVAAAGLTPADIGAVLVQSFLPDEVQPKNAALVAHNLGIRHAPAWEVDSVCNSLITQVTVGSSLIMSGFARHVLCVQSAAYSRVSDPSASSSVQEGDLAAAFVLGPSRGTSMAVSWRTDGRLHAAINLHWARPAGAGGRRWWDPAGEALLIGFDPALQAEVMGELERNAHVVCDEALQRAELPRDAIDILISHQPNAWQRAFMEDILGLRDGAAFDTFEEYASVNSPGLTASVHHAIHEGRIKKGSNVLLFGPAAGYTYAALAIRW